MSDEKPFSEVVGDTIYFDRSFAMVATCDVVDTAALFNTAVSARERKAAAKALREAARDFTGHRSGDDEWTADDVRAWLRSRAAALEGGAS